MPIKNLTKLSNLYVPIQLDIQFLESFGKNFKELRKSKGFSQALLAFEANIEISQISRIERGKINTSINSLKHLSDVLGIPIEEFFKNL